MPNHGVAVTIPEPWATTLQSAREAVGDHMASAIPPHVTLLPPTAIRRPEMSEFLDHLRVVAKSYAPFEMVLSGTGTFRPVSPVVFVQVSRGIGSCEGLERAVRSGPVEWSLDFPYHPHVTIAHHLGEEALDENGVGSHPDPINCLAMTRRWISLVPSPMVVSFTSRRNFSAG